MKARMYDKGRAGFNLEKDIKKLIEGKAKAVDTFMEKFGFKKNSDLHNYTLEIAPGSLGFESSAPFKIEILYGDAILATRDSNHLLVKIVEKVVHQTRKSTREKIKFDLFRLAEELTDGRFYRRLNRL